MVFGNYAGGFDHCGKHYQQYQLRNAGPAAPGLNWTPVFPCHDFVLAAVITRSSTRSVSPGSLR